MSVRPTRLRRVASVAASALLLTTLLPLAGVADDAQAPDPCHGVPADAFRDVPATNLHRANIDCIAAHGIVLGVGGGNYGPSQHVTRGQMTSFLVNLVEVATGEVQGASAPALPFADAVGTTHALNIAIAADLGIARGIDARTFAPRQDVNRAQMATFVAQAITAAGGSLPAPASAAFGDVAGSVHAGNIGALARADIVSGVGRGQYDPNGFVTRAQMATFLVGAIRHLAAAGLWPELPAEEEEDEVGLELTAVVRPTEAADLIEVRWSLPVTPQGAAGGYRVLGADGQTLVASGTSVVAHAEKDFRIHLDAGLQGDATYWLQAPAGAAVTDDGLASEALLLAFVFSATGNGDGSALPVVSGVKVDGVEVASGGSVTIQDPQPVLTGTASAAGSTIDAVRYRIDGGAWLSAAATDGLFESSTEGFTATLGPLGVASYQVELRATDARGLTSGSYALTIEVGALVPTIESVVTDPANDRLVVTFDTAVVCPDRPNTRRAFMFLNDGAFADPSLERGFASTVTGSPQDPRVCWLGYDEIADADQGLLSYSQPSAAEDRVTAVDGGAALASITGIPVTPAS